MMSWYPVATISNRLSYRADLFTTAWSAGMLVAGCSKPAPDEFVFAHIGNPGLKATVRWSTASSDPQATAPAVWHEKVLPIDRYEEPGTRLNVHFLPDGEVRLVNSSTGAGRPAYPGPVYPVKPKDFPF